MSKTGWPSIDPGDLRHFVTIQSQGPTGGYDAAGPAQAWLGFTTAWAAIVPLRGTDVIRAGQDTSQLPVPITIRFQPGIQPNMRVRAADYSQTPVTYDYYTVRDLTDIEKRGVLLELECIELGGQTAAPEVTGTCAIATGPILHDAAATFTNAQLGNVVDVAGAFGYVADVIDGQHLSLMGAFAVASGLTYQIWN